MDKFHDLWTDFVSTCRSRIVHKFSTGHPHRSGRFSTDHLDGVGDNRKRDRHRVYSPGVPLVNVHSVIPRSYPQVVGTECVQRLCQLCGLLDPVGQLSDLVVQRPALSHLLTDFPIGVHDSGVVATTESLADPGQ